MKLLFAALLAAILSGCAIGPRIDSTYTSVSQGSRVRFLIIHHTVGDFPSSLKVLTQNEVSSHYLVNRDPPDIYRLVDEGRRANHAGLSSWKGYVNLNDSSIGIEIVNRGAVDTPQGRDWEEFPKAQVDAVIELVKAIVKEHAIRSDYILGHSDIAPQRKVDPGPRFPWKRLAEEGIIPWPDATAVAVRRAQFERELPDIEWFQAKLARHGFEVPRTAALDPATVRVIAALQMKYRPERHDGQPDAETAAILDVLTSP